MRMLFQPPGTLSFAFLWPLDPPMPININHQVWQSAVSFRTLALFGVVAVFSAVLIQPSAFGHASGLNTTPLLPGLRF